MRGSRIGTAPVELSAQSVSSVAPKAEQSFVPVELVGVAEEDARGGAASGSELDCVLEVVLRDGQIVRVGSDCHPQLLGAVLAILRT